MVVTCDGGGGKGGYCSTVSFYNSIGDAAGDLADDAVGFGGWWVGG